MDESILDLISDQTTVIFRAQPFPVGAEQRPAWRIALIVLLLSECCRSQRATLTQLHLLSWSNRSVANRSALLGALDGRLAPDALLVRFEPALNRAIDFARGMGFVEWVKGSEIQLSDMGKELSAELRHADALFVAEKAFMASVGLRVTKKFVNSLYVSEI